VTTTASAPARPAPPAGGFATYCVLWSGQFVSMIGSELSGFALGVYIYQLTGSATTLGSVVALSFLPMILGSPFAGALVDRWGTRKALAVANAGALATTFALAALLATGTFAVWHVYVIVAVNSALRALQWPAFASTVPLLVPKPQLGRANGMRMFAMATSQILAPVAAGGLLMLIGINGIIVLDLLSFGLAMVTVALVRIPRVAAVADGPATMLGEIREAWRYVVTRPGLVALLVFIGALNFAAGFVDLLLTPLVLAFATPAALGVILSVGGAGVLLSSVAMTAWSLPRRQVPALLWFTALMAGAAVLGSLRPDVTLLAVAAFAFMAGLAVVSTANQNLWQSKVEPAFLGRAMALQNMVVSSPQLVAYAMAGALAEHVFAPIVGRDEVNSPFWATLLGQGAGRGTALLLLVVGLLLGLCALVAALHPRVRRIEDELPDVADA
jgi:MFS family permease